MRRQASKRSVRARGLAAGFVGLALLAVSVSWPQPGDHDEQQAGEYPADCPGRLHQRNHAPDAPPELVQFYVPPYGFIWGYPFLEIPQRAPAMPPPAR